MCWLPGVTAVAPRSVPGPYVFSKISLQRGEAMKTLKILALVLIVAFVMPAGGCTSKNTTGQHETLHFAEYDSERHDVLYTCSCGPQCGCDTVSTKPGKCACGMELKWGHVLKTEKTEVILCQCPEGCRCYGLDNREYYCNCGFPIKRVDLAGTGIYFCNCGSSCYCNTVSDKPGKCRCGADLKKVG